MERPWLDNYDPGVPREVEIPEIPFTKIFDDTVARFPRQTAIWFYGRRISYQELDALASRYAGALIRHGVSPGDRVALYLPNCPQFVIAYFGTWKAGAIVTPVNPLHTPREIRHQLSDSGSETIIALAPFYRHLEEIRDETPLRTVVVARIQEYMGWGLRGLYTLLRERSEGGRPRLRKGDLAWLEFLRPPNGAASVSLGPDDLALLQYTGGTTGVPKGAVLTHSNLVANNTQCLAWIRPVLREGEERILSVLPFFHLYGIAACLHLAVLLGATMVILPRFRMQEVLQTIRRTRPTLFPCVPTAYIALNHCADLRSDDLRSLKFCLSGAAPLPVEVQEEFERRSGCRMAQGYGMTEASPVTHLTPLVGKVPPGSAGYPVPGTDARIVDLETGEEALPPGERGEIVVRGPQVMRGYWNMPTETANVLRDGWLHTGDIGTADENGAFFVVDRKKDMIISGGVNVYPREVEEVLYTHPGVREAAVVGIPDPYWGEAVKAFIVPAEGASPECEEIREFCRARLAKFKVPKEVEFRPELPKSLAGKVLRRELREAAVVGTPERAADAVEGGKSR